VKRAKDVMDGLLRGKFEHNDMALYLLQMNANAQHKKTLVKRKDLTDMRNRVAVMYPIVDQIPHMTIEELPVPLKTFLGDDQHSWKIEWFYGGDYICQQSGMYKEGFQYNRHGMRNVYAKLIDTMGFSKWDMAYKMWIETLCRPEQVISYEGMAFHVLRQKLESQKARMMSMILDFEHVITVTIVN